MQDDFEWEVRHPSVPFYVHLIGTFASNSAGSCAGISEHLFMLPFDNIKTHCQAGQCLSIREIARKIYRKGGVRNFYSGSTVLAAGCIPAHGLYFSIYEFMMDKLGLTHHHHNSSYLYTTVGFTSSLFHDLILTPTEAIKQRLQLYRSDRLSVRAFDVVKGMLRNEGIQSFYRSFGVNYFMNVPYGALLVTINEKLKESLMQPDKEGSLLNYFAFAGVAGLLAAVPTCPLDVIKTRLNTQNCINRSCGMDPKACGNSVLKGNMQTYQNKVSAYHSYGTVGQHLKKASRVAVQHIKYHSVVDAAKKIYREAGLLGFFRGLKMRILIQCPSSALSWGTYQMFKRGLSNVSHHH